MFGLLIHQFRRHWVWIKWLLGVVILILLYRQNQEALRQIDWHKLSWSYFFAGTLLTAVAFLITFVRWYYLVIALQLPFQWRDAVRLGFIGLLFNYIAPGAAGGDIVKALLMAKEHPESKTLAATTVLIDRVIGLVALFCVGSFVSVLFFPLPDHARLRMIVSLLWAGTAAGLIGLFLMLHTSLPKSRFFAWMFHLRFVGPILEQFQSSILLYQKRAIVLWAGIALSIVGHVGFLTVFYFASQSLNAGDASPSYLGHLLLIPGAELVGVVIPTPAGIGALEGAVQGVFVIGNQFSAHPVEDQLAGAAGFSTALVFRAMNLLTTLIGAVYYFFSRKEIEEVLEEEEHVLDEDERE